MDFSALIDQIKEQFTELWQKINENETVIQLVERYNSLSPIIQKSLIGFVVFLVAYVLYTFPAGFISSASDYEQNFISNRNMIRGLFRVARNSSSGGGSFRAMDFNQMKSQVNTHLRALQITDQQRGPFQNVQRPLKSGVPSAIKQEGLSFQVKKINVKQIAGLSERLSSLSPNTKLAEVAIQADQEDDHYYNVTYVLSSLSLDTPQKPAPNKGKKNSKSPFRNKKRR